MTNDFKVGDAVILDGEYYANGVATEHIIEEVFINKTASGVAFRIKPMPDTINGREDCIDSGWFALPGNHG